MNNLKYLSFIMMLFLNACSPEIIDLSGKIIFNKGLSLYELNLKTLKEKEIIKFPGHISLSSKITGIDNHNIIISDAGILKKVNIKTKHVDILFEGTRPTYLKEHNALFYYVLYENDKIVLLLKQLDENNNQIKIMEFPWPKTIEKKYGVSSVLQVSMDEVIFKGVNLNLWKYNLKTNKLIDLQVTDCIPHLVLNGNNLLSEYFSDENRSYYILDLTNKRTKNCSLTEFDSPKIYLPKHNFLLYNSISYVFPISERYPLMILNMLTGEKKELLRDEKMYDGFYLN